MSDNTYEVPATPGTREEEYYAAILGGLRGDSPAPSIPAPVWRNEQYLAAIAGAAETGALPAVTEADAGKVLAVGEGGEWGLSDDTVEQAVSDYLDDHPEATTTVEDGSITKAKLDSSLQGTVDDVADLKSATDEIENRFTVATIKSQNLLDPSQIETGAYYWTDGRHASGSYNSTPYIQFKQIIVLIFYICNLSNIFINCF